MTIWIPRIQSTILFPSGPTSDPSKLHLLVVLNTPQGNSDIAIVPVCSVKPAIYFDPTCRLYNGDHEFIQHDSYIEYRFSRIMDAQPIVQGCLAETYKPKASLDAALFARVHAGVFNSPHTPQITRTFLTAPNEE